MALLCLVSPGVTMCKNLNSLLQSPTRCPSPCGYLSSHLCSHAQQQGRQLLVGLYEVKRCVVGALPLLWMAFHPVLTRWVLVLLRFGHRLLGQVRAKALWPGKPGFDVSARAVLA